MEYDVFISHASEDKGSFVAALANILQRMGVKVWYDKFTLRPGDSLSGSIDYGLSNSSFGIVVLSKGFMSKGWTEYELRGLIAKEIGKKKVILTIWHNVSKDEVLKFSPPLADKFALDTSKLSTSEIALQLAEVIRPDIFQAILRRKMELKTRSNAKLVKTHVSEIFLGPIRHETLPETLLIRIKIFQTILRDVFPVTLDEIIDKFRRETNPLNEVLIWERITATYLDATKDQILSLDQRKEISKFLLLRSMGPLYDEVEHSFNYLTAGKRKQLEENFFKNVVPSMKHIQSDTANYNDVKK